MSAAAAGRRGAAFGLAIAAVPSALVYRVWRDSAGGAAGAAGPAASNAGAGPLAPLAAGLPDASQGRAWLGLGAAGAGGGVALGLALGLAPHLKPGAAEPLSRSHRQGALLGVAALGIATGIVCAAAVVGRQAVFFALGCDDAAGFIAEMKARVPAHASFLQARIAPVGDVVKPAIAAYGASAQSVVDGWQLENHAQTYLGISVAAIEADGSDPLAELGDDPLQNVVDRLDESTEHPAD